MVFERFPVERQAFVFFAIAVAALELQFAALVADILGHVLDHVSEDIEAHQIDGPEGGRARPTDGGAGERVDLFDRQVHFLHEAHHVEHGKCADAIADEVGSIFRPHHALAELRVAKMRDGVDQCGVGVWRGDQFQQTHIARRIEKVRAEPRAPEVGGKSLGDFRHRKSAGIGGNDGAGLADRLYLL